MSQILNVLVVHKHPFTGIDSSHHTVGLHEAAWIVKDAMFQEWIDSITRTTIVVRDTEGRSIPTATLEFALDFALSLSVAFGHSWVPLVREAA